MAILKTTTKYKLFELHVLNRNVDRNKKTYKDLVESMRKHGFLNSKPLMVVRSQNGKLLIKVGHHRFMAAQELGIPVKYVIEDQKDITIHELEKATSNWKLVDYLVSYQKKGIHAYTVVQKYCDETGNSTPYPPEIETLCRVI